MAMTREEVIQEVETQLQRLHFSDLILIHNEFCWSNDRYEDVIHQDVLDFKKNYNDDDDTHNNRCRFGFTRGENINIYDALSEPVVLNGYGNFELADEKDIYIDEIAEWIVDNDKFNEFSQLSLDHLEDWDLEEDEEDEEENKD